MNMTMVRSDIRGMIQFQNRYQLSPKNNHIIIMCDNNCAVGLTTNTVKQHRVVQIDRHEISLDTWQKCSRPLFSSVEKKFSQRRSSSRWEILFRTEVKSGLNQFYYISNDSACLSPLKHAALLNSICCQYYCTVVVSICFTI